MGTSGRGGSVRGIIGSTPSTYVNDGSTTAKGTIAPTAASSTSCARAHGAKHTAREHGHPRGSS
eukprot:6493566-Prymnesium_polylepis.1